MKTIILFSFLCAAVSGCGPAPVVNTRPAVTVASTPELAPQAVTIDKPANVSFSTYSKEWPVNWLWIEPDSRENPTRRSVKTGVLRLEVPSKKDFYGENRTAPRYLKSLKGDFQIETRVKFLPKENYQGAGLLIFKDDHNYLRFERAYGGIGGGGEGIRIDIRESDDYRPLVTPNDIQTDAGVVDLKIVRAGQTFIAYWRLNEKADWSEAARYESDYPEAVFAGLIACNTAEPVVVEFGYIRLLPYLRR